MKFEIVKDNNDKKFIWLKDVVLGQGLKSIYSVEDKKIIILDPDSKDYEGEDYENNLTIKEVKYGIVQKIDSEAVIALSELMKVLRTIG